MIHSFTSIKIPMAIVIHANWRCVIRATVPLRCSQKPSNKPDNDNVVTAERKYQSMSRLSTSPQNPKRALEAMINRLVDVASDTTSPPKIMSDGTMRKPPPAPTSPATIPVSVRRDRSNKQAPEQQLHRQKGLMAPEPPAMAHTLYER